MAKIRKKIPSRSDCDPTILRIYDLLVKRRKIDNEKLSKIFGVDNWKQSSAKWRYIEAGLNFLDAIGSDDNLYKVCEHCGTRNPFDYNYEYMTDEQVHNYIRLCENPKCMEPLHNVI